MIKVGPRNLNPAIQATWNGHSDGRDDIYVDKQIVRQDYPMKSSEGEVLCSKVKSAYPDHSLPFSRYNIIGAYDGYREPYENSSISFYDMFSKPPFSLIEKYGVSQTTTNLKAWYGLKFDLTKDEVLFKCVVRNVDGDKPELPKGIDQFFATTHSPDKSMSDWVDYYVAGADPEKIKAFCEAKGLKYPFPDDLSQRDVENIVCFGFVFNKATLEYGVVKGYAKRYTS
jgi:hypothetical protein